MLGLKSNETGRVSEEELRLIVTGAKMSGGIESQEGMMIEGVLDLQVLCVCVFLLLFRGLCFRAGPLPVDGSIEALSVEISSTSQSTGRELN